MTARCMVVKCPADRERYVYFQGMPVAAVCPVHQEQIRANPGAWLLTQRLNEEPKVEPVERPLAPGEQRIHIQERPPEPSFGAGLAAGYEEGRRHGRR